MSALFKKGLKAGFPICIGYFPIAVTFGVLASQTGLNLLEATGMSIWVFAGASQFISLQLIQGGTGILEIIIATFIINLRHVLMSTTLSQRVQMSKKMAALSSFGITDETFVVATVGSEEEKSFNGIVPTSYFIGIALISYLGWVSGTFIGALFAELIPPAIANSMGIGLYSMFIALLTPSLKKSKKIVLISSFSAITATIAVYVLNWSSGWAIVAATMLGALLGTLIPETQKKK
ncbi:AzlC family ABC transporter permease [Microaerobacter geothermalis]|uniref:AzlC family ABC transporter permease n=1 Tax=Microaerobacter geothermalis TaxID=674972 RepID=UPI001F2B747A|nr:AzlC family ABC transporter permease [Microaerobacter geothermalis]MCF6094393.1 AzlC family ABC transporter permease [Microaerobacter geothermalis]